jgi:hypothetical protein
MSPLKTARPVLEPSLTAVSPGSSKGTTFATGRPRNVTISGCRVALNPFDQLDASRLKLGNQNPFHPQRIKLTLDQVNSTWSLGIR